jgi:molybdate transport system substrate-binding protein
VDIMLTLRGLSSMATRGVLAALTAEADLGLGHLVMESAGGVEVARRLRGGEQADVVVLASDAIDSLAVDGFLDGLTIRPLFVSEVVVGVPKGAPVPDIGSVEALTAALVAARRIGYSTGPSGSALLDLVEVFGLTERLADRWVQAPPGMPVARLLGDGAADLGFQQRSELSGAPGVTVVGPMPPGAEIITTFSGAVPTSSEHPADAVAALARLAAPATHGIVSAHALSPAT